MTPQGVANTAFAVGRLQAPGAQGVFADMLRPDVLAAMSCHDVGDVLSAAGKLGISKEKAPAAERLAKRALQVQLCSCQPLTLVVPRSSGPSIERRLAGSAKLKTPTNYLCITLLRTCQSQGCDQSVEFLVRVRLQVVNEMGWQALGHLESAIPALKVYGLLSLG